MSWTPERVETLKKLWGDGLSATEIAYTLGGVSRSSVLGKVFRLGLSNRAPETRNKRATTRPKTVQPERKQPTFTRGFIRRNLGQQPFADPLMDDDMVDPAERRKLCDLESHHCRWPIGDPLTPEFGFCNRSAVEGLPYCEHHARRAYPPAQDRAAGRDERARQRRQSEDASRSALKNMEMEDA